MQNKNFSIIIPVHNEEAILKSQLTALMAQLESLGASYEIILVENGSIDKTVDVLEKLTKKYKFIRYISLDYPSYGEAIKAGVKAARYDIVVRFDIEFWDTDFLKRALSQLSEYDIVVGSKNLPDSVNKRSFEKNLLSKLINGYLRTLFNVPFTDTHGLKVFRKNKLIKILDSVRSHNHFFESEFLVRAHYLGHKIKEIPVEITELRKTRFPLNKRLFEAGAELMTLIFYKRYVIQVLFELHADDFGYRRDTDRKTLSLIKQGKLASVSVMATKVSEESIRELAKYDIPVYAHIDLIEGKNFIRFATRVILWKVEKNKLREQIKSQIEFLIKNGIKISGIDSEQHTHALSPVAEIVERLAKEYDIPKIRSYKNVKTYTLIAKLKYLFLRSVAYLSGIMYLRKFSMPASWKIETINDISFASWEGKRLQIIKHKNDNLTYVTHPFMGFDHNLSYGRML